MTPLTSIVGSGRFVELKQKLVAEAKSANTSRRLLLLQEPLDIADIACRPDFISQISTMYQESLSDMQAEKRTELKVGEKTSINELKNLEKVELAGVASQAQDKDRETSTTATRAAFAWDSGGKPRR